MTTMGRLEARSLLKWFPEDGQGIVVQYIHTYHAKRTMLLFAGEQIANSGDNAASSSCDLLGRTDGRTCGRN
jgi:hypothetical protein